MKKLIFIPLLSVLITTNSTNSYNQPFLTHVSEHYLNSFGPLQEKPKPEPIKDKDFIQRIKDWFKPKKFTVEVKELTEREKRERIFTAAPITPVSTQSVVDTLLVDKLELLQGGGEDQKISLFSRILKPYLYTKNGERSAVSFLVQPITPIAPIRMRQNAIRSFYNHQDLLERSTIHLKNMADAEHYFLDFFEQEDPAHEEMYKKVYWGAWMPSSFNYSATALEAKTRLSNVNTFLSINAIPLAIWLNSSFTVYMATRLINLHPRGLRVPPISAPRALWEGAKITGNIAKNTPWVIKETCEAINEIPSFPIKAAIYLTACGGLGIYGFSLYKIIMDAKFQKDVSNHLQTRMIGVASYLNSMKEIYQLAKQDAALSQLPCMASLAELVDPSGKHSQEFNSLVKLLSTNTFTSEASFFSITGRVLAAFKLMQSKKEEFADALNAIGEIETYIAVAKLMHAHDMLPNGYSFVEFIESDKPYIKMTDFWNPMVDATKAVSNSIEFSPQTMRSMILTGPNTGGKSTGLKGMMINGLLGHVFGVCAAKHMVMTTCTKLISYLNVTDNTMAGISGLKAEILRAKELINTVRALPYNQFAFIIIDEIFTATSPDQAEKLAYDFLSQLCSYENCIFVDATHYAKLTELEKETNGTCKNYQVEVITDTNGKVLKYTYKIKEGISEIKNASQVANEENIFNNRF